MPGKRLKRLSCCMLVLWLGLHAGQLCAQTAAPAAAPENWHFQYDLFQLLLERQGAMPVATIEQALALPQNSLVVIAGDPMRLPSSARNRLSRFVHQGGALLVATDSQSQVPDIGRFVKGPVTAGDIDNSYQGYDDCVKVTALANEPLLAGIATIVTNRSGWLEPESGGPLTWTIAATFPKDCLPRASRSQPLLAIGHATEPSKGVVVLAADASLFTNGMLWHGDNAVLAIRISTLLASSGRTRLAFWADGQMMGAARQRIEEQAATEQPQIPTQPPLPEPELNKVLKLANAVASEVARSNVLNETLQQRPRGMRPSRYFRFLLAAATILLLAGAVWMLVTSGTLRPFFAGRANPERPNPGRLKSNQPNAKQPNANRPTALGQPAPHATYAGDYRTPAGYLAREFCWELTGSRQSTDWQKYLARQLIFEPTLSPSDEQDLAKIIDIASRGCRERMSGPDFQRLGQTIAALRGRHAAAAQQAIADDQPESAV